MKSSSALFLQLVIVLLGLAVAGFLLWEPHVEGRNAHATTFEIYFKDPFLAYVYVGSIPFFLALYRAFGLLGHVRRHGTFSALTVNALRTIKHCALALMGFVAGAVVLILLFGDGEDRPAGVFMSGLVLLGASAIAIVGRAVHPEFAKCVGSGRRPRSLRHVFEIQSGGGGRPRPASNPSQKSASSERKAGRGA